VETRLKRTTGRILLQMLHDLTDSCAALERAAEERKRWREIQ